MDYEKAWLKLAKLVAENSKRTISNYPDINFYWRQLKQEMQKIETEMMNESLLKAGY